jgi:hypothetical protein
MGRTRRHTLLLPLAAALLGAAGGLAGVVSSASAAEPPTYNMLGTWTTGYLTGSTRESANGGYDITAMNMATGAVSGTAETSGIHFTLEGFESGSVARVKLKQEGASYVAYDTLPLSVLGSGHMGGNGTFNSTGFDEPGTGFWAEQNGTPAEEAAKKAKEQAEREKRPTGTSIICNYEFATSQNTCVASVGDGGAPPSIAPTGTVTFTTTSGGFSSGAACSIAPTPSSPSVASCSLVYFTTSSGLPSITATYSGDAHHAPSSGKTQFLGMGTEGTFETPAGPSGQYPNEVGVETEVPISGTTVEAAAQGEEADALPLPITLPAVQSALDATSAADLRIAEALTTEVDVQGLQNPVTLSELDKSIEKLDARVVELTKSPSATEQAEAQKLLKDATETTEMITNIEKLRGEYGKDAITGSSKTLAAQQTIDRLGAEAVKLLESSNPADQAKGQAQLNEATKQLEALLKAARQRGETVKNVIGNASAAAASRPRLGPIKTRRVRSLGHVSRRNVAAGKLKLKLKLNRAALNKLAGRRNSVAVYVRVDMVLPSKLYPRGVPRAFVQRITLKRTPAKRRR